MRHLCARVSVLDTMGRPEIRVALELLIDTGPRPDEICQLRLDCLDRDTDGKLALVYDNHKNQRLCRRLPIPSPTRNLKGRKATTHGWVGQRNREWVERLPEVAVPAGGKDIYRLAEYLGLEWFDPQYQPHARGLATKIDHSGVFLWGLTYPKRMGHTVFEGHMPGPRGLQLGYRARHRLSTGPRGWCSSQLTGTKRS